MQTISAIVKENVWFVYDSAPSFFSIAVRNHIDAKYPGRWIEVGEHVLGLHVQQTTIPQIFFVGPPEIASL